jgi:hypothetical protein
MDYTSMLIEAYKFGKITISGETYHTDVLIFPNRVRDQWWRQQGHQLLIEDLKCIIAAEPEVLIVGTGYTGALCIPPKTHRYLTNANIEVIAKKTQDACPLFNSLISAGRNVVAALHLSC